MAACKIGPLRLHRLAESIPGLLKSLKIPFQEYIYEERGGRLTLDNGRGEQVGMISLHKYED
jgi:hypothetical protein